MTRLQASLIILGLWVIIGMMLGRSVAEACRPVCAGKDPRCEAIERAFEKGK